MKKYNMHIIKTYIGMILTVLFFSSIFHTTSYLVSYTDPYTISFFRYLICFSSLLIWKKMKHGRFFNFHIFRKHFILFNIIGIVGFMLYFILFLTAIKTVPVIIMAVIFALNPGLSTIAGVIFLKDRLPLLSYVGLIVTFIGSIAIVNITMACGHIVCVDLLKNINGKYIVAIAIVFPAVIYNVCSKLASKSGVQTIDIVLNASLISAVFSGIFCLIFHPKIYHTLSIQYWTGILYVAIPGTVLGYVFFSEGVKVLGLNKATIFLNAIPIGAILIEVLIYHKSLQIIAWYMMALIIFGVSITNLAKSRS